MVDVRAATAADVDAMLPLFEGYQRFYGHDADIDADRNRSFFGRFAAPSDDGALLVATDGDEPVGFACVYWTISSTNAMPIALMNDLFVVPGHRGERIGERLIEGARDAARERGGMHHLEWYTAPDNATAQRLYDRTGAERSEWVCYELDL